jgi:hypothetical protein
MDPAFRPVSIGPQSEPQWNWPSLNTILLSHPRKQQQWETQFFTFARLPASSPLFFTAWFRAQIFHVLDELAQQRHHNAVDDVEDVAKSKLLSTLRRSLRVDPPSLPPLACIATVATLNCRGRLLLSRGLVTRGCVVGKSLGGAWAASNGARSAQCDMGYRGLVLQNIRHH